MTIIQFPGVAPATAPSNHDDSKDLIFVAIAQHSTVIDFNALHGADRGKRFERGDFVPRVIFRLRREG
jgi:hypothetical protein